MSHHIYHTHGIILGSISIRESNRFYKIFTKDLGLVSASAQSVREGKSKLRYSLQDFSFITLDLVRGKEVWRITSAGEWLDFAIIKGDTGRLKIFARFCALLSRLLQGEGCEPELFADIVGLADFLEARAPLKEFAPAIEALAAFRALVWLGYLDGAGYEIFLEPGVWTAELLENFEAIRPSCLPKINEALRASHL